MTSPSQIQALAGHADALRALHAGPQMLVLPNAWDAVSARAVEAAGFPAVATTSAGVALSLGYEDHQKAPLDEMAAAARRIVQAVSVPVTVDFEAGYGMTPEEVVRRLIDIGAAGYNYEDTDHVNGGLVDAETQAGAIAGLKAAGRAAGADLVVNARVDVFILRQGSLEEQIEEGLKRARLYSDAGADCVYPILLADEAAIRRFVEAVGVINVNLRPGGPLSLQAVAALGVRRVSYAASLFREAQTFHERLTTELRDEADKAAGSAS